MDARYTLFAPQHFQPGAPFAQEYFNNEFRFKKKEKKAHRKMKSHQPQLLNMLPSTPWLAPHMMLQQYPHMQPVHNVGYYPDVTQGMNFAAHVQKKFKGENLGNLNTPLKSVEVIGCETDSSRSKPRKAKKKCMSASSRYKGVSWHKRDRCYMARVWVDGSSKHVGSFQQEMRAALAVDHTLLAMGKDSSHLNFPVQLERDIAASILKHQTVSQDVSSSAETLCDSNSTLSEEEMAKKGLDRNGFPNCIESVLADLLADIRSRKIPAELDVAKEKSADMSQRWESLVEEANKQKDLPITKAVDEASSRTGSENSLPAGDTLESDN